MWNKKTLTALFSLALAGSMSVSAFAAGPIPVRQTDADLQGVVSEGAPVTAEEGLLTRAELVSVLYEQEGKPSVNFAMDYTDVNLDDAYAEAVRWAASEKIAGGYGDGRFGPDDAVTREQMAVILYRYAQSKGQGFTGAWAFPLRYSDAGEIREFAYEAVCWMTMKNIMGDVGDNMFAPRDEVSRQDADSIFAQYFSTVEQVEIANPFVSCETMSEAAQVAGFSMELPDGVPDQASLSAIRAVESAMIEVLYEGDQQMTLRKGIGTEEISGDYSTYSQVRTETISGNPVMLKGDHDKVMVATWSHDGYTYAVRTTAGLDHDTMAAIVAQIQ